jgi:hypothetical protein
MTEIEQRYVIEFIHAKKFGLDQIVAQLASVCGEQAYAKKRWRIGSAKSGRPDMEDEEKRGRLLLDDVDAIILACLSHEPFSSVPSNAQALDRHVLTRELRDERVRGARALLNVLRQQEKTHFRVIITGDESWTFIDTAPSSIWLSLDEEPLTRPRRTISADKRMLIAFWGIKGLVHVKWLLKDVRINAVDFRDKIVMPMSRKLQTNVSGGHKPWTLVHMDNAKVHTAKVVSSVMPNLRLRSTPQPLRSPDICPSGFFLFGWLKGSWKNSNLGIQTNFLRPSMKFSAYFRLI